MKQPRLRLPPTASRRAVMAGIGGLVAARPLRAAGSAWRPTQPVRVVISAAPGGTQDIHARAAAPILQDWFGVPVVLENNGGAGGRLASAVVGRAAPDGLTALVASGDGLVVSDLLYGRAQGLLRPRLKPVMLTIAASQLLVTRPDSKLRSVQDYIAAARTAPGTTLGIPGHGGIAHIISEMLQAATGTQQVLHVPYRGGGPATLELLAGQIQAMIITLPAVTDHVRSGRLRPLGVSTLRRDPAMPDVPSFAETVAPGFDVPSTRGVLLPAASLQVLAMGYVARLTVAAVLVVLAIASRFGSDVLATLTAMFNPLPAIALLPPALLWFGIGTPSLVFVIAIRCSGPSRSTPIAACAPFRPLCGGWGRISASPACGWWPSSWPRRRCRPSWRGCVSAGPSPGAR